MIFENETHDAGMQRDVGQSGLSTRASFYKMRETLVKLITGIARKAEAIIKLLTVSLV